MAKRRRRKKAPKEAKAAGASWWKHAIAAFVLFHLCANCLGALPNVGHGLNRRVWADARARRELDRWATLIGVERETFEETVFGLGVGYQKTRETLLSPFEPYLSAAGLRQSWLMFNAGTEQSYRFGVRARRCEGRDCDWETLFVHADPDHDWRAAQLGHPRVRSMIARWSWSSFRASYEHGCGAIANLAFDDFPDARVVQCRFESCTSHSQDPPTPPPPRWEMPITVRRPSP